MSEEHLRSHLQLGELGGRASSAASALLQKTTGAQAPDLRHIALARRLFVTAAIAVLGLLIGSVLLVSFLASGALPWIVGVILILAAVAVIDPRFPCRRPRLVRPDTGARPGRSLGAHRVGRWRWPRRPPGRWPRWPSAAPL